LLSAARGERPPSRAASFVCKYPHALQGPAFREDSGSRLSICVEIVVPLGGFDRRLDDMYAFLRDIEHALGRGRRDGKRNVSRWLFRREDAEAIATAFGGSVVR
jgi:hypothetical protein